MLALYHNALSTCSQKVRLVLAHKGLEFESREIDLLSGAQHDPEYVKLNPKHVVPTLVHDGRVLVESSLIIKYLDDAFPEPAMRPADALGRYAVDAWLKRADEAVHVAAPVLTFAGGPRKAILLQPEEVREAAIAGIPDARKRAERRSVIEHGVKAPEYAGALGVFLDALDEMERDLGERDWLSGDAFGLADATLLPYALRVEHLGMDPVIEARPRVAAWFARAKALPCHAAAVDAWAPAAIVEMMRTHGKELWPEVEPLTRRAAGASA